MLSLGCLARCNSREVVYRKSWYYWKGQPENKFRLLELLEINKSRFTTFNDQNVEKRDVSFLKKDFFMRSGSKRQ